MEADLAEGAPLERRDWIAGLEKGLGLLEAFDEVHPRMNATQAALRCGLTRTAARRYLLTLAHLGYVGTDGKLFWLTPRVLRLGQGTIGGVVDVAVQRRERGAVGVEFDLGWQDGDVHAGCAAYSASQRSSAGRTEAKPR